MFCFFRTIKKLKQALPLTPNKRADVLSAHVECKIISKWPGVEKIHASFEESVEKNCDSQCTRSNYFS